MAWKILHKLFGLHFVLLRYGYSDIVRRVRHDAIGRPYIICCGHWFFLLSTRERWDGLTFDKKQWLASFDKPKAEVVPITTATKAIT
jgi:hypothetical protein